MGGRTEALPTPGLAHSDGDIEARLSPANPSLNLSRLMCARRLEPHTAYVVSVVPTFRAGTEAALRIPVSTATLAPSWGDDDDPATEVVAPVYFSFTFSTGDTEDFNALAERLVPVPAPPGVGRRRLDTSRPGAGIPEIAVAAGLTPAGSEMVVEGPLVSLPVTEADGWPPDTDQQWPAEQHARLRQRLNDAEVQRFSPTPDAHPTVGPPLYAGAHVLRTSVTDTSPGWFRELTDDPRNRVVAGVGARVAQHDQEALMAEAWNQVGPVEAANAALRSAQLGRYVGASIHRRHVATLSAPALLALTHGCTAGSWSRPVERCRQGSAAATHATASAHAAGDDGLAQLSAKMPAAAHLVDTELLRSGLEAVGRAHASTEAAQLVDRAAVAIARVDGFVAFNRGVIAAAYPVAAVRPAALVTAATRGDTAVLSDARQLLPLVGEVFRVNARERQFRDALTVLATVRSTQDRALLLAEVLDTASHRLDAWLTSLATSRLDRQRGQGVRGVTLGA